MTTLAEYRVARRTALAWVICARISARENPKFTWLKDMTEIAQAMLSDIRNDYYGPVVFKAEHSPATVLKDMPVNRVTIHGSPVDLPPGAKVVELKNVATALYSGNVIPFRPRSSPMEV